MRSGLQCGLCILRDAFETEIPKRLVEFGQLAENGDPQMSGEFVAHLEAALGMKAPLPGQSLRSYRRARGQLRKPSRQHLPAMYALWTLMGDQPPMAKPLLRMMLGATESDVSKELDMSLYNVHITVAKGVRTALRYIR